MRIIEKNGNKILTVGVSDILRALSLNNDTLKQLLEPGNCDDIKVAAESEFGECFEIDNLEITVINPVNVDKDVTKKEIIVSVSGGVVQDVIIPDGLSNVSVVVKDYDNYDGNDDECVDAVWPM